VAKQLQLMSKIEGSQGSFWREKCVNLNCKILMLMPKYHRIDQNATINESHLHVRFQRPISQ
jgi:hypothetical protein